VLSVDLEYDDVESSVWVRSNHGYSLFRSQCSEVVFPMDWDIG
jgi:hypothetical protein